MRQWIKESDIHISSRRDKSYGEKVEEDTEGMEEGAICISHSGFDDNLVW